MTQTFTPPSTANAVKNQRIVSLDIAKAICIILVVIGHYVPDNSPDWYVMIHDVIYTFHMPLFMFASGYVYIATKKEVPYGEFLLKKVKRLMVPYFATSAIVISIKLVTQGGMSVDNPVTVLSFVKMFYQPEAGYFLWFIWALWWMFVLVPLFKKKQSRILLFAVGLLLHFLPLELTKVFSVHEFSLMLVWFMLGIMAFETEWLHRFLQSFSYMKVAVASVCFACGEGVYLMRCTTFMGFGMILSAIGIWFIIEVSKCICKGWKEERKGHWLMVVSVSSYIIYLFHTTFEGFTKAIVRKLPIDTDMWYVFVPSVIVVVAAGVMVPIVLHRCVLNRFKLTRVLFGL